MNIKKALNIIYNVLSYIVFAMLALGIIHPISLLFWNTVFVNTEIVSVMSMLTDYTFTIFLIVHYHPHPLFKNFNKTIDKCTSK